MKEKISGKDYTPDFVHAFRYVFRGGNLIFPLILGAKAGKDMPLALLGMLVSAVGFPLLGIISMGISKSEGLLDMAGRVSKGFAYFFHLRPLSDHRAVFAIPRCGATSFAVGFAPLSGEHRALFSTDFHAALFCCGADFSLRPSKSPIRWENGSILFSFCCFRCLFSPCCFARKRRLAGAGFGGLCTRRRFFGLFCRAMTPLDVLASLAFGIIVINVIRGYGVENPSDIAKVR